MNYIVGKDGLLDFAACSSDQEKVEQCWEYFQEHLGNVEVVAFDGMLVRGFTRVTFEHIISGSSNNQNVRNVHDIPFVEDRAKCLPLIKEVITGNVPSRAYTEIRRGRQRRVLTVVEVNRRCFVVVMDILKGRYAIRTAFPSNIGYCKRCIESVSEYLGEWKA